MKSAAAEEPTRLPPERGHAHNHTGGSARFGGNAVAAEGFLLQVKRM